VSAVEFSLEVSTARRQNLGKCSIIQLPATPVSDGVNPMWGNYPRDCDVTTAAKALKELEVDVLYSHMFYGCTSIQKAAIELQLPIVAHVHDFAFLCGRSFLVDNHNTPCDGPTTVAKCERCLVAKTSGTRRIATRLAGLPGGDAVISAWIGNARAESLRLRRGIERFFSFRRSLIEQVSTWIVTGTSVQEVLLRYGVDDERITTLPHAIPDDRIAQSPGPPPLAERPLRIGYFGRISPEKGVYFLADALQEFSAKTSRKFEWRIISGRVDAQDKDRLVRASGLDHTQVKFTEGVTGPDLNAHIAQLDLCVIPSIWPEIGPLTLLESIAQGVPCICNDLSAHADLITDGVNGFQFRTAVRADLVAKLLAATETDAALLAMRNRMPPLQDFEAFGKTIETILKSACDGCMSKTA